MGLGEDLLRIAGAASAYAADGEEVAGVLAAEPSTGARVYLCAFEGPLGRAWLALDDAARPLDERARVRAAASIAALCELAEESSGGGELEALRGRLRQLRLTENPPGIEEAEEAALSQVATQGTIDEQALALRDAMRVLFPEAVALVSAARQGFMRER